MLLVYLFILALYTGGLAAQKPTLSTDVCPKDSPACKGCTGSWIACPGKDGVTICSMKNDHVDPKSGVCDFKDCPVGEGKVAVGKGLICVPFKHLANGTIPDPYFWEGCQEPMLINCGTWTPICIEPDLVTSYNESMGGCVMEGCPPKMHPCKGENGTECIAYDDLKSLSLQAEGFECVRATAEDKAAAKVSPAPALEKTEPNEKSPCSHPSGLLLNSACIILAILRIAF